MISSVSFPKEGNGYVYKKIEEPVAPNRYYREYSNMSPKEFAKAKADYKKEHAFWEKHKDDYENPFLAETLVAKTFNFCDKKINVLFGPNACGKSTIIKAIAGTALITDGFTKLQTPTEIRHGFGEKITIDHVLTHVEKLKMNTCNVVWDGEPIYVDRFSETYAKNSGVAGGLVGSVFGSFTEEIIYRVGKNSMSEGQKTNYLLSKMIKHGTEPRSVEDIIANELKVGRNGNSTWANCYNAQAEYLESFEKYAIKSPVTFVFDEIDKSLDIMSVYRLYTEELPMIVEKLGIQIIMVSHNPIILCDAVFNNDKYNIVSLVDGYTENAKNTLKNVKF